MLISDILGFVLGVVLLLFIIAFAVAAATIDTYAAAAKTLNDPTIPSTVVRIAMMAAVILRGLGNVKQILSVKMGSTPSSSAPSSIS